MNSNRRWQAFVWFWNNHFKEKTLTPEQKELWKVINNQVNRIKIGCIYGSSSPRSKPHIKNSQTCEVNQKLFAKVNTATPTLDMPLITSTIDGSLEFNSKEVFVCDDGKRYTWQEFWRRYKELKAGKGKT